MEYNEAIPQYIRINRLDRSYIAITGFEHIMYVYYHILSTHRLRVLKI